MLTGHSVDYVIDYRFATTGMKSSLEIFFLLA